MGGWVYFVVSSRGRFILVFVDFSDREGKMRLLFSFVRRLSYCFLFVFFVGSFINTLI